MRQVRGQHPRDDQKGQGALLGAKPPVRETQVTRKDIIVGSHPCLGVAQAPELPWVLWPSSVFGVSCACRPGEVAICPRVLACETPPPAPVPGAPPTHPGP